ncbi:hypothetical protein K1719_028347 [Acacia pycnantha]|nr:hypothetical protein K1719_028347 [Acacia pycnantha]
MEERVLQNPSGMIDEARDQIEHHLQVPKNEVEDQEDESSEELGEDPVEEVELKQLEETTPDGNDRKSGVVKSNDKKRCLNAASGELTTLLCYQSQKKCRQVGSSGLKLESGPPDNDSVTAVTSIDNSTPKEGTGSSEKRSRSRWEPQSEDDDVEDNQTCKRKKARWSNEDTQLKMLGPLQLPDFRKDFLVGYENNPEIQELKAELVEINRRLHGPFHDDKLEEERSPSPEPIYDNVGNRINSREARLRQKLVQKRQDIISKLIKSNQSFSTPPDYKPPKFFKKLYIPVNEYPEYNFVGLIIGPRGNTLKRMENETGAKIHIRGNGCTKTPNRSASSKEDLQVYIEADNKNSLDAAVAMVEKLLIPVEGRNEHKEAQLKELAKLKGTARDEDVCYVCGDQGHLSFACPDLRSTFKVNPRGTCLSATPLNVISPQNDSMQGSGFGFSSSSKESTQQQRPEKKSLMNNIYVGNLPQEIDDNRLSELFSPFGKILEAKMMKDARTGISRQVGFIEFDNAMDAQAAVTRMNGFRMDGGRFLNVMIARLLSYTECLSLNLVPKRSGSAGISQSVRSQKDRSRPRPLHVMLPEHPTSFHNSSGRNLFSPPSCCSSTSDLSNSGKMHFSRNFSDQSVSLSGSSISESPGSQYQSYSVTPPLGKAALPNPDHRSEDAKSFPSSLQRRYFRELN